MINEITTFLRNINLGFISFHLIMVFIVYSIGFLYKKYWGIYCQLSVLPYMSEELVKLSKLGSTYKLECERLREFYMRLDSEIVLLRMDLNKLEKLKKEKDNASTDK